MCDLPEYPTHEQNLERRRLLNELGDQITELAAHMDAAEYRFLVLVERFHRKGGWEGLGLSSCAHWLNWKCGLGIGVAREKVRVAITLPDLPKISEAFRRGKVSYSKVRAMTRVATVKNEHVLLNVALHGTASHVEKQVQLYRQVKRAEALSVENKRHDHRELSWYVDHDGYWRFNGRFTPEQGAVLCKALEAAMDKEFAENSTNGTGTARTANEPESEREAIAMRRADALERVAESYLVSPEVSGSGGERYMINLHVDIETLKTDGKHAEARLEDRCNVPAETSRRMACDASVIHWHENANGDPLNVGRKTRSIPPAIRRALHRRDRGCRFPGCTCTRFVDSHHVRHWADGGETRMNNLLLLCRRHHRLVHEGGFAVRAGRDGQFTFTDPGGKTLHASAEKRSRGNVYSLFDANHQQGLDITPKTAIPRWCGEKMDNELAVLGLVQME